MKPDGKMPLATSRPTTPRKAAATGVPSGTAGHAGSAPKPTYTYRAVITHQVDGDTVGATLDLGLRLSAEVPVRLYGINCPEHDTPAGKAAAAFTADWCARHSDIVIVTQKNPEKYGRWLGTLVAADGENLNDELVAAGHALAYDGHGPKPV